MDKVKRQRLIMLITVISSYYGFSDLYTFFGEKVPELDNRRVGVENSIKQKQNEMVRLRDFAKNIELVKQELRELDIQLETALEALPRTPNFAELLRRMDLLAQNSGVDLRLFRPKESTSPIDNNGAFYTTLQVSFLIRGSFTQALVFFDQMSRLKRLINIQEVRFARDLTANNRTLASDSALMIEGVVKTFQFKE